MNIKQAVIRYGLVVIGCSLSWYSPGETEEDHEKFRKTGVSTYRFEVGSFPFTF
jgi:hypothetical protein